MTKRRSRKTVAPISSSPRSERMKHRAIATLLGVLLLTAASPARAANKEHQQLMADLRMLQEQAQLLQNLIGSVTDALKAVNTRLDQQAETTRKNFADQKLVIDNLTNDVRVIREKLDDNNVRIGSLTQEVESLRSSLQQIGTRPSSTGDAADPTAPASGRRWRAAGRGRRAERRRRRVAAEVVRLGDGRLLLRAVRSRRARIHRLHQELPQGRSRRRRAGEHLFGVHPGRQERQGGRSVRPRHPDLSQRRQDSGRVLQERSRAAEPEDVNGARAAWEHVVQTAPDSDAGRLAKQRLDQIKRPN